MAGRGVLQLYRCNSQKSCSYISTVYSSQGEAQVVLTLLSQLSWFNPSQQLNTTQPFPPPPPNGVRRRKAKEKKVKLVG